MIGVRVGWVYGVTDEGRVGRGLGTGGLRVGWRTGGLAYRIGGGARGQDGQGLGCVRVFWGNG